MLKTLFSLMELSVRSGNGQTTNVKMRVKEMRRALLSIAQIAFAVVGIVTMSAQ